MPDAIFENYELFIKEHAEEIGSAQGALRMLNDEGMFRAYVDSLTEGLDDSVRANVSMVLNREREMILSSIIQEGANVPNSSFVSGWTVMAFPILVDIYSEPIIAELCNVYPIDKPVITIPRVRIKSQTKSYDGTTTDETYIPTATSLVRAGMVTDNVVPGTNHNFFTSLSFSPEELKMNRRYTIMTAVKMTETDTVPATHDHTSVVNFRPDNRSQIVGQFTFQDSLAATVSVDITGHINYERGTCSFQAIFSGGSAGHSYVCDFATFSLRFVPTHTMNGRTKVIVEMENTDVFVDPNEDQADSYHRIAA